MKSYKINPVDFEGEKCESCGVGPVEVVIEEDTGESIAHLCQHCYNIMQRIYPSSSTSYPTRGREDFYGFSPINSLGGG